MKTVMTASIALLALAAVACSGAVQPPPSLVGKAAPEIKAAYWLNSDALTLAGLKGKVVVVEFWATWCPPCRKSIPHLIELNAKYAGKGVVIIGLSDEPKTKVEPFAKEMKMTYAVGGGTTSLKDYGINAIPTAFIIDTEGKVAWQGHPMDPAFDKTLEAEAAKVKPAEPKK
jgi:thiol-disulfide isomerase/thioredoxin